MKIHTGLLRTAIAIIAALLTVCACAVTVDGGDYGYMPHGSTLGVLYLQHFEGRDLYARGRKVSGDAKLSGDVTMLRGVWYRDWGDYGVVPQFLLPFGQVRTGGSLAGVNASNGAGDLLLVCAVHFIKDPTGRDAFSIAPWLWLPTGHYDKKNGLNPFAENRWKFALQIGRILKVSEKLSFEVIGDVQIHGDNNDFGAAGATLEQAPLRELQAHVRYFPASPTTYLGALVSHIEGGATRTGGAAQDDRQNLTKVLFSVGHFVSSDTQIIVSAGKDISIRTGIKEAARVNFRMLKLF